MIYPIILASASPRRQELLAMLGLDFTVMASSYEERAQPDPAATPAEQVMAAARGKAEEVFRLASRVPETADSLVVGADTIVVLEGEVLGKPGDQAEARRMLRTLSALAPGLYRTGFAPGESDYHYEMTRVHFRPLSDRRSTLISVLANRWIRREPMGFRGLAPSLLTGLRVASIMLWASLSPFCASVKRIRD